MDAKEKTCCKCKKLLSISEFYVTFRKDRNCNERFSVCKSCSKKYTMSWRKKNRKRAREIDKKSRSKRRSQILEYSKNYYQQHAEQRRAKQRAYWIRIKDEVYESYGGYVCACCGEKTKEFLSIDHIDGGGNAHRRKIGKGPNLIHWLRSNGFPKGFQILCMNCQFGKKHNGGICPHKS